MDNNDKAKIGILGGAGLAVIIIFIVVATNDFFSKRQDMQMLDSCMAHCAFDARVIRHGHDIQCECK